MTNEASIITINLFHVWIAVKVASAFILSRWESKYIVQGENSESCLSLTIRRFITHLLINPEWGLVKMVAFFPVWVITGTKHISKFLPVKTNWLQSSPSLSSPSLSSRATNSHIHSCRTCNGSGSFVVGNNRFDCSCQPAEFWRKVAAAAKASAEHKG